MMMMMMMMMPMKGPGSPKGLVAHVQEEPKAVYVHLMMMTMRRPSMCSWQVVSHSRRARTSISQRGHNMT
eukprot:4678476-Karenia_brevis.AAC.1